MQTLENKHVIIELDDDGVVRVRRKDMHVAAVVKSSPTGFMAYGEGDQAYLAHGRDFSLLIMERLSVGMAPALQLV